MRHSPAARRRATRLSTRMVAVLLVPTVGLGVAVGSAAWTAWRRAAEAQRVEQSAEHLRDILAFGFLLEAEVVPLQLVVDGGVDSAALTDILGEDLDHRTDTLRAEVNRAAAPLAEQPWVSAGMDRLTATRAHLDAGRYEPADLAAMSALELRTGQEVQAALAPLVRRSTDVPLGEAVDRTVGAVATGYQAYRAFAALSFSYYQQERADGLVPEVHDRLVAQRAQYQARREEVMAVAPVGTAAAWRTADRTASAATFLGAIDTTLRSAWATPRARSVDLPLTGAGAAGRRAVLNAGLRATGERADLVERSTQELVAVARDGQRDARHDSVVVLALALLCLAGAGAAATLLVRGVVRPLRRLSERARRIADGDVETRSEPAVGPREVREVAGAVDEIAATLRRLDGQAAALAAGDLSEELLETRAPGRLGRSLQLSMERLVESITAREELESRLRHEATHDRLTGLLNRAAAVVALETAVMRCQRSGSGLAVLVVDLDDLTRINETGGHDAGDQVLRAASSRLRRVARAGDVVARLGADEFVVVAEVEDVEAAVELARRVRRELQIVPLPPQAVPPGAQRHVGASIGVALALDGFGDPAQLLHDADLAVRRAKSEHGAGSGIELFDEKLRSALDQRARIERALVAAMGNGDLRLHYQPIVDADGWVLGAEALCRWDDPELGAVSPEVFIGVAEASDLIIDLDRWVLQRAAAQLLDWEQDPALDGLYLSVNVSSRHFQRDVLVPDVRRVLDETGIDPRRLVVEITETVLMADFIAAADQLGRLRALGVRVAVDDFGTGYTSISHLQRLPIDIVKIDRSFVADISGERGHSLVRLMVGVARTLGLGLVAEGVERPEERDRLRELGCGSMQGYLFGRPGPASAVDWRGRALPLVPQATGVAFPPVSRSSSENEVGKTVRG